MFKDLFVNLLQKHSITAYKLSKDTGITEGLISQWKSGRQLPKYDSLKILCDYFNVSADYLLGRDDEHNPNQLPKDNFIYKKINIHEAFNRDDTAKLYACHIFEAYNELCNANELFLRLLHEHDKIPTRQYEWIVLFKYTLVVTYETCEILNAESNSNVKKFNKDLDNILSNLKIRDEYDAWQKKWAENKDFFRAVRNICAHFDHEKDNSKDIYHKFLERVKEGTMQISIDTKCLTSNFNHLAFIEILNAIYEDIYIKSDIDKKEDYVRECIGICTDTINCLMPVLKPIVWYIYSNYLSVNELTDNINVNLLGRETNTKDNSRVEKEDKIYSNSQIYILKYILREFFETEYALSKTGIDGLFKKKIEAVGLSVPMLKMWLWNDNDNSFRGKEINSLISVTGYSLQRILAMVKIRFNIPYNEIGIKANIEYNAAAVFAELSELSDDIKGKCLINADGLSNTVNGEIAAYGGTITGGTLEKEPETTI